MMRMFFFAFLITVGLIVAVAGFRGQKFEKPPIEIFDDMDHQPKYKSQVPSYFFQDGLIDRKPVAGTVAHHIVGTRVPD
jgi:hypothetical protein